MSLSCNNKTTEYFLFNNKPVFSSKKSINLCNVVILFFFGKKNKLKLFNSAQIFIIINVQIGEEPIPIYWDHSGNGKFFSQIRVIKETFTAFEYVLCVR